MPLIDSLTCLFLTAFNAGVCNKSGYERQSVGYCKRSSIIRCSVDFPVWVMIVSMFALQCYTMNSCTLVISHIILWKKNLFCTDHPYHWPKNKFIICIISVIYLNSNKEQYYLIVLLSHNFRTQSSRQIRHLWRLWTVCAPCWEKSVSCAVSHLTAFLSPSKSSLINLWTPKFFFGSESKHNS